MLSLPPSVRVFVATAPADLRKSFDGLSGLVRSEFGEDPLTGHVFVFIGRECVSAKILWWDRNGFAIFHKRLARGRFHRPPGEAAAVRMEWPDLLLLLEGIDLVGAKRRPRWDPRPVSGRC